MRARPHRRTANPFPTDFAWSSFAALVLACLGCHATVAPPDRAQGTPECEPGACVCESDGTCSCPATSPDATCTATCDASCDLQCDGSRDCQFDCGEDCLVLCFGSGRCDVEVDRGSRVRCVGRGDCSVGCRGPCVLDCEGTGLCELGCEPDEPGELIMPHDCGGGRHACDPCPG